MSRLRVVLVGSAMPDDLWDKLYSGEGSRGLHAVMSAAAQRVQWALVRGLELTGNMRVDMVSWLPIGYFPWYSDIVTARGEYHTPWDSSLDLLPSINLPILRQATRRLTIERSIHHLLAADRAETLIVCYAAHSPALLACVEAARTYNCKVILIMADLPQFMDVGLRRRGIARWAKSADVRLLSQAMQRVDGVVSLTEDMVARANLGNIPHIVIQGIVDDGWSEQTSTDTDLVVETTETPTLFYAGGLSDEFGVGLLLDAVRHLKVPFELNLCGTGPLLRRVLAEGARDPKIRYLGVLPHQHVVRLEHSATLLVNPRPSSADFVRYSFPSKLLEYMISGRPVVSTVLPCIPQEYWDVLIPAREETPEGLARVLDDSLQLGADVLALLGRSTRAFAKEHVGVEAQGKRLWSFFVTVNRSWERRP
jgi:glycosyltransferase involved in cell wall biosynthesis